MQVAILVIFGKNWGSGHVTRALALSNLLKEDVTIFAKLEDLSDAAALHRYSEKIRHNFLPNDLNKFDVIINDTLGLFQFPTQFIGRKIYIDAIHYKGPPEEKDGSEFYSILYPVSGRKVKKPDAFLPKQKPLATVFQGGGDDHEQILNITKNIPAEYEIIIGIGFNCRHIKKLQEYSLHRGNSGVLIGVNPATIARCASVVITAGGNTLYELLQQPSLVPIILYSKEFKEHSTFSQVASHSRVIKKIEFEEDFSFPKGFSVHNSDYVIDFDSIF